MKAFIDGILNFAILMAILYYLVPVAFHTNITLLQSAAITLLAFMAKDFFRVEPEIYLINGNGEDE
jgi:hypothetical protein